MFTGAVHLTQQWSLYLSHQSNLLQQLFCPILGTAKTYPYLSIVSQKAWSRTNKLRKAGGLPECHKDTNAVQRLEGIIPNYLEMLSKATQAKVKTETDLKWCSIIDSHGRFLLWFSEYWPPRSAKFLKCLSVWVNATMYIMFLHSRNKNTTALIICKVSHLCVLCFSELQHSCVSSRPLGLHRLMLCKYLLAIIQSCASFSRKHQETGQLYKRPVFKLMQSGSWNGNGQRGPLEVTWSKTAQPRPPRVISPEPCLHDYWISPRIETPLREICAIAQSPSHSKVLPFSEPLCMCFLVNSSDVLWQSMWRRGNF